MAKTVIDEEIHGMETSWENYTGKRVEEFLKKQLGKKVGYTHVYEENNNAFLYGFASEDAYLEYETDPEEFAANVISKCYIPAGGGGGASAAYIVGLELDGTPPTVTTSNVVKLRLRFTSKQYNPITQQSSDTNEEGVMTIQTRIGTGSWQTKKTILGFQSTTDGGPFTEVDISDALVNGTQAVRISVKGDASETSTTYVTFSITVTNLALVDATNWQTPMIGDSITLRYRISGAVDKVLHVEIDGKNGTRSITSSLGTQTFTDTAYEVRIDRGEDAEGLFEHGVHKVRAWLSANNGGVKTNILANEIMYNDRVSNTPMLALCSVMDTLTNWTVQQFFQYAVFNPEGTSMPLQFKLTNNAGTAEYMDFSISEAKNGVAYTYQNMLEIEDESQTAEQFGARMRFYSDDKEIHEYVSFTIDNSNNFAPTAGAEFVMNPKLRSNEEANPKQIINQVDGQVVQSEWLGFGMTTDGWVTDEDGSKCLRLLAGKYLNIGYEAFSNFLNHEVSGADGQQPDLTIEIDYATRNSLDTEEPVIRICSYNSEELPVGFELKAQEACFLTVGKSVRRDQDVFFQEGVRTHLAINIIHNQGGEGQNYIKLFINGVINREMQFDDLEQFVQFINGMKTSQGIRLGGANTDLDIYGIRIYRTSLSSTNIHQDYIASLPTSDAKLAERDKNDITGDDGHTINYNKCYLKYNTMVWEGERMPSKDTDDGSTKVSGNLTVHIIGDPAHSGTLYNVNAKGQGTSSMRYWKWNQGYKFKSDGYWVDELGFNHGGVYQLDDTVPEAKSLVAKLNWASSCQSHKIGSTEMFDEAWKEVMGSDVNQMVTDDPTRRVAVKQKPFFMFFKGPDMAEPVFYGLYTFGPAKKDKPTFGYKDSQYPHYWMIEGSDNGASLANFQMPWNDEGNIDVPIYNADEEAFQVNGENQLDFDLGNIDDDVALGIIKRIFNFAYTHSLGILPFEGNHSALCTTRGLDTSKCYWITQAETNKGFNQYDLFRYSVEAGTWVNAGVNSAKLNVRTQFNTAVTGSDWDRQNQLFINARIADFKANADKYIHIKDTLYHMAFCKLIAASDNRAKNTYMYLDLCANPVGDNQLGYRLRWQQDDLDTIFLTDNVGRKTKTYYLEEHDTDEKGAAIWNAEGNIFFNLMEGAYDTDSTTEMTLRSVMRELLTALAAKHGSVFKAFDDLFFSVQRYFPAVAYNEIARILYEAAWVRQQAGQYENSTNAIAQSLGDQLQAEIQYIKNRIIYISSWCSHGMFQAGTSYSGGLTFRSVFMTDTSRPVYQFQLKPCMWMYPAISVGVSVYRGPRTKAFDTVELSTPSNGTDGNTDIAVRAIDYMLEIGDFGDKPLGETFTLNGARLQKFIVQTPHKTSGNIEFRPTRMVISAPNLRELVMNNVNTVTGDLNMATLTKMQTLDLQGCTFSTTTLPSSEALHSIHLPASLTSLEITAQPNLTTAIIDGYTLLSRLDVDHAHAGVFNSQALCQNIYTSGKVLDSVTVRGANWNNVSANMLMHYCNTTNAVLTGNIAMLSASADRYLTYSEKIQLIEKFGDIDSQSNGDLYIEYPRRTISSITVRGDNYIYDTDLYAGMMLGVSPSTGNNVAIVNGREAVKWTLDPAAQIYAELVDDVKGIIRVKQTSDPLLDLRFDLKVELTMIGGSKLSVTKKVGFYHRIPKIGDFAYYDGTFDDQYDPGKTLVGTVIMKEKIDDTHYTLKVMPKENVLYKSTDGNINTTSAVWGLYPDDSSTNGFPTAVTDDIKSACSLSSATDTAQPNRTTRGLFNADGADYTYIRDESYLDPDSETGYKAINPNHAAGDYNDKSNTDYIIAHCKTILRDYLDVSEPGSITELCDDMLALKEKMQLQGATNPSLYYQFYYPAAMGCRLYEPSVNEGEELHEAYKKGNWDLPAFGTLCREYNFFRNSRAGSDTSKDTGNVVIEKANENPDSEALLPLFANLLARVRAAGYNTNPFTMPSQSNTWSSTEYNAINAWLVNFNDGYASNPTKYLAGVVRAVAAFSFEL